MKIIRLLIIGYIVYPGLGLASNAELNATDDNLYLSIVGTELQRFEVISKYRQLNKQFESLSVVSSDDCTNLKPGLVLFVSAMSDDKARVKQALSHAKNHVADSYLRECVVKNNSLLSYNIPYIHSTLIRLPEETINWSFDDIKSEIVVLDNEHFFQIEKKYNGDIDSATEGRQSALYYLDPGSKKNR
jgi:hypothetical protein